MKKYNVITNLFILFFCSMFFTGLSFAKNEKIEIKIGERIELPVEFDIGDIGVKNANVCNSRAINLREFFIEGKSVGQTTVTINGIDPMNLKTVNVIVKSSIKKSDLNLLLKDIAIEKLRIRVIDNNLVIDGETNNPEYYDRVEKIAGSFDGIINIIRYLPDTLLSTSGNIRSAIFSAGIEDIRVDIGGNRLILNGAVNSQDELLLAEKIATAYDSNVINALQVKQKSSIIEMTLNVMDIEKSIIKDIGINWNPGSGASDDFGASGSYGSSTNEKPTLTGTISGTISNLLPKMKYLREKGKGRSLMQQSVIVKEGDTATFFTGSEIPIPILQEAGISIEYKNVGVSMSFKPIKRNNSNDDVVIYTPIKIESSNITMESIGGAPVIGVKRIETSIEIENDLSIALGGVIDQRENLLLSNSPPGGASAYMQANKGERKGNDLTQVIVFITPRIIEDGDEAIKYIGTEVEETFKEQELKQMRELMKTQYE